MPQLESIAEGGADTVAKDSSGQKIRIAIADDHTIFRDGLRKLLSLETDFEVCAEAKDGSEVLDVLRQSEPDILLLDLKMPGIDGIAALQRIQNQKLKTKIIVLTASDDEGEYVQAMKYGTSGIVLKQTATELLIKSIRKVHLQAAGWQGATAHRSRHRLALRRRIAEPILSRRRRHPEGRLPRNVPIVGAGGSYARQVER